MQAAFPPDETDTPHATTSSESDTWIPIMIWVSVGVLACCCCAVLCWLEWEDEVVFGKIFCSCAGLCLCACLWSVAVLIMAFTVNECSSEFGGDGGGDEACWAEMGYYASCVDG